MIDAIVVSRNDEAQGICSFELASADGSLLPAFSPGPTLTCTARWPGADSLCNHPQERHRYLIGVLHDPASRGGSRSLHEQACGRRAAADQCTAQPVPLADGARRSLPASALPDPVPEQLARGHDFELHCARSSERAAFVGRIRNAPFADRLRSCILTSSRKRRWTLARCWATRKLTCTVCVRAGRVHAVLGSARELGWQEANLHRSISQPHPWTPATTAASRYRSTAPAKCSRCQPTRPWYRYWSKTASRSPCRASKVFAARA